MTTIEELKHQLRSLKRLKRDTRPQTDGRRDINRKIRDLKKHLGTIDESLKPTDEKQKLIDEIRIIYRSKNRPFYTDIRVYTVEELQVHLNKLKGVTNAKEEKEKT